MAAFVAHFLLSSRRRHTRLVSDWSSDVCSSDLESLALSAALSMAPRDLWNLFIAASNQIGRASCRERVEILVVAVSLKKIKRRDLARRSRTRSGTDFGMFAWCLFQV